jgi:hypothetical protein
MKKLLILTFTLFVFSACATHRAPTIMTETKSGEVITQAEIQRTADKNDMPAVAGTLLAIVETTTATGETAKTYIVQETFDPIHPFKKRTKAYQNDAAKKASPATGGAVLPELPWYHWPMVWLEWIALIVCIIVLLYLKGLFAPAITFIKGLLKCRPK